MIYAVGKTGEGVEGTAGRDIFKATRSVKPGPGSLTAIEARLYYNSKLPTLRQVITRMEAQGASREAIAREVSHLRNVLKQRTRDMMADRVAAESLPPIRPFEYYVEKYSAEGLSGDALYNRIIEKALTPNPVVNVRYGIQ